MKEFEKLFNKLTDDVYYKPYWDVLLKQYVNKDRHYHNLQHIIAGLDELKEAQHLLDTEELIKFAWWYHDSIYFTGFMSKEGPVFVKDNEEKSAMLACGVAKEMGMSEDFIRDLEKLILLTKHDKEPESMAGKIIIDIDLSILGKSQEIFDMYEAAIRKEYSWVPEDMFRAGRTKILQTFIDKKTRKNIYYTDHFRNKYEDQARKNIERSLFNLSLAS
ncbi:hypothetical protein HZA97_02135 [Candidatus Woesearchaeota archaeon]|nr:hypothetical protein [Candidatus Woesearchaeota archaeon]